MIDIPNVHYWQPKLGDDGVVTGIDEIAQAIETILMTQPGAVPLLPLFGAALLDHVDGPITSAPRKLERAILRALRTWEPRIEVVTVKAEPVDLSMGVMAICITWKLKGSNDAVIQLLGISNGVAA